MAPEIKVKMTRFCGNAIAEGSFTANTYVLEMDAYVYNLIFYGLKDHNIESGLDCKECIETVAALDKAYEASTVVCV